MPHLATPPRRVQVLIVGHVDGWLEVYAPKGVDVHLATMPDVQGAEAELLAERLFELLLPRRFRQLFAPVYRRAANLLRCLTPRELSEQRQWQRACGFFTDQKQTELHQWRA
jgi:hypothetical protein